MFVEYHRSVFTLLTWQWRAIAGYALLATFMVTLYEFTAYKWFAIPPTPLTVIGAAIGIFVSFRTNSCYDRWWEGRRLWGQLVNTSRHFATQALSYVDGSDAETRALQRTIVRRHIAYVHALRRALRGEDVASDPDVRSCISATEFAELLDEPNPNHALLHEQSRAIAELARRGRIDGWRLQLLDQSIAILLDVQGGCERIKKTPFPQSYGFVGTKLIAAYCALVPLGIVDAAGWMSIPITVLVCLAFRLIDEVGDELEDPFTLRPLALPLEAIARTIEIDLKKRLSEPELPEPATPDEKGVLM